MIPALLIRISRLLVFTAFALTSIVAITSWAVRARRLSPFGAFPRFVRRVSQPLISPMERRLLRSGGNPVDAPYWLLGIAVVGGLLLLSVVQWLIGTAGAIFFSAHAGPRAVLALVVGGLFSLLIAALLIRVVASWLGISPYGRWMRPVIALTNWLVEPIRRVLPPFGILDFSPAVAMLIVWLARALVMSWI